MGFWDFLTAPPPSAAPRRRRASSGLTITPAPRRPRYAPPKPRRVYRCLDCTTELPPRKGSGRMPTRCPSCRLKHQAAGKAARKWEVDPEGLVRVQEHFGLEHPLHVKRMSGRIRKGTYRGLRLGLEVSKQLEPYARYHVITINGNLSADEAARTVLHEACHAAQFERDPVGSIRAQRQIRAAGDKRTSPTAYRAYHEHPSEVEARAAEALARELKPLRDSRTHS